MSLASCEVILDTYNLRLRQGSGIKTYGLTLIESLRHLGATVSVLSDRNLPRRRDPMLDEIHFFDPPPAFSLLPGRLRPLVEALKIGAGAQRPVPIRMRHVIQTREQAPITKANHIYNVSDVYDRSHRLHRLTGRHTTIRLERAAQPRIWHATTPLPIRVAGTPMVTTVHDLIPLRLPYMTRDHKRTFHSVVKAALRDSALVLAVSEFTKRDLLELFEVDERKIVVTYETFRCLPPVPEQVDHDVVLGQHKLRRHQYVLYVGNVDPRKNLKVLFQAMGTIPNDLPLVLAGRKSDRWEQEIEEAQAHLGIYDRRQLRRRLRLLDYVPSALLQVLYRNALCLVMPSFYEGFGLPVLEAMRHDCPVISSDRSSLPEIGGSAALYFDPEKPYELTGRILSVLEDPVRREAMVKSGREQAARFAPERYAETMAAVYGRVLAMAS